MRRHRISLLVLGLVFAGALPLACGNKNGDATYVLLRFEGSVPAGTSVAAIVVSASLAGSPASATFTASPGTSIALPTTGYLEIGTGEGSVHIHGVAQSAAGVTLAEGDGDGTVTRGSTTTVVIELVPTATSPDAGVSGPAQDTGADGQLAPDLGVDKPVIPNTGGTMAGTGGSAPGSGGVSGVGGAVASTGGVLSGSGGGLLGTGGAGQGGTNVTAKIIPTPEALAFSPIPVGTISAPQSISLTNAGDAAVGPLSVYAQDPSQFTIDSDGCSGTTLKPSTRCLLTISFSPMSTATQVSNLVVSAPGARKDLLVPMTGAGMTELSAIDLAPKYYDFGVLEVGSAGATAVFTLRNTGNTPANLNNVDFSTPSPDFQVLNDACSNASLRPAAACTFTVSFKPSSPGSYSNTLNVRSTNGAAVSITIRGTGKQIAIVLIQLTGTGKGGISGQGVGCAEGTCKVVVEILDPTMVPSIALQAVPQPNSVFAGYAGGPCGSAPSCTLDVSGSMSLTAQFDLRQFQLGLRVIESNGGTGFLVLADGSLVCPQNCGPISRLPGSVVVVNAKPGPSSTFTGWTEGPCKGTAGQQCQFSISGDTFIAASFGPQD